MLRCQCMIAMRLARLIMIIRTEGLNISRLSCLSRSQNRICIPYVMSVVNVLLAASIAEEKGLKQTVVADDCILSSKSISGFYIDENGIFQNIMDSEIPMLSGNDLDGVSEWVDESISKLNEILFA